MMPVSPAYRDFVLEQLDRVVPMRPRIAMALEVFRRKKRKGSSRG